MNQKLIITNLFRKNSIFEKPIHNDKEIAKLINECKGKYGDTEIIESLIKKFIKMKKNEKKELNSSIKF